MSADDPFEAYVQAQAELVKALTREVFRILRAIRSVNAKENDPATLVQMATPPMTDLMRTYRAAARRHTFAYLAHEAERHDAEAPESLPDDLGYSEQAVRTVLQRELKGADDAAAVRVSAAFGRHVKMAGRDAMVQASEETAAAYPDAFEDYQWGDQPEDELIFADPEPTGSEIREDEEPEEAPEEAKTAFTRPFAWARVLTGSENCGFCIMLAARGPVYASAVTAQYKATKTKVAGKDRRGRKRARVIKRYDAQEKFHIGCDCEVVAVYTSKSWPGKEQHEAAKRYYEKFSDQGLRGPDLVNAMNAEVAEAVKNGTQMDIEPIRVAQEKRTKK